MPQLDDTDIDYLIDLVLGQRTAGERTVEARQRIEAALLKAKVRRQILIVDWAERL